MMKSVLISDQNAKNLILNSHSIVSRTIKCPCSCTMTVNQVYLIKGVFIFFEGGEGGVGRRNPYEHECFVNKCDPPPGSSKIYSDPPLPPDKHVCGWIVQRSRGPSQRCTC